MTNYANRWIKAVFDDLKTHFPYVCKCKLCKGTPRREMEFSHERATELSHGAPRGRKEKYYDIKRHPKSYKLRSHKCHILRMAKQHRRFRREAEKKRRGKGKR